MAKRPINHRKEFKRNKITIGKKKEGYCNISEKLFNKFEAKWQDRRK